ncbi:MAG: hypothetical protein AUH41_08750 [Gemmatimonadetes bacterium 13_1_40CM_66_11]|nr:MAG: hypothetical protein AUH41_08750 [Gemmatimonadetes bacterium 13_1_40CM_66_11]
MTQQVPFAWRLFNLLGHQRGLLYGSVALVVLVAAYRVMTHRPLVGGVFEFALGLAVGVGLLTMVASIRPRDKQG